ncbi:MAG: UDP-N-acetylglucosamine 2-epimerase (non-hydrolyzing) [Erysipelotrichaceae bacterium]|jgi:UDP-N-acetylglucosamine 2-epimerase (non-hydrolysing)|nr:UDP-N-acetylglucosamine 2-epimerase (non-hydrolyzing) [Erysipelotrichaceae bacterium]
MKKLKVMTILGTRPEIIRLSETIKTCDQAFNHLLVHTEQNYDFSLSDVFFKTLSLRQPDYFLDTSKGSALGTRLGQVIEKTYKVMYREKPDAVIILGDTNSSLAAIAAKRLKIPIFHLEAGNRCHDENVPEMCNRRIVDHIADINVAYTEQAKDYLLQEGLNPLRVFVSGTPLLELYSKYQEDIMKSHILKDLDLEPKQYIVLSMHREENIDQKTTFKSLIQAINEIAERYRLPVIFSAHPRTKKQLEENKITMHELVHIMTPLSYFDYMKLQQNAFVVLSDSGSVTEECQIAAFPAVLIRTSTERPEGIDWGNIVLGGVSSKGIINAIEIVKNQTIFAHQYQGLSFSKTIVSLVQGYTEVINQEVWKK